jgi:mono/diheme cytochrome c family protein
MKILLRIFAALALLAGIGFALLYFRKPAMAEPRNIKVAMTPERVARGKYLFEILSDCAGCHSDRDPSRFGMPVLAGRLGAGFAFPKELGLPGDIVAPNITPDVETGIGAWTDGEIIRAVREGVSRDGRALFPFMPYPYFRSMSDEDVESLVAYIRSLPPVKMQRPPTKLDFPLPMLIKSAPQPVTQPVAAPERSDPIRYGEYLVTIGVCRECHSTLDKGQIVAGTEYGGGQEFAIGPYLVRSANITPDPEAGIGTWSEQRFIEKFRGYRAFADGEPPKAVQANFTLMPWLALSKLTDEDLKAIYAFLRTVKPVAGKVDVHPALPSGS